jgi:hypothetical protein
MRERRAAVCKQTIPAYLTPAEAETSEFARSLRAAVAAMEAVSSPTRTPAERDAALASAAARCRAAADACRRDGFDLALLRAGAACDEAALLCDRARRH